MAWGMTRSDEIDERRATGTPVVYRHNTMGYVFDCPYWPGSPSCGMGSMQSDFPTEAAARKAWEDHARMRHPGKPVGWPADIPGRRPPPAPRKGPSGGDPNAVDPDQGALF